MTRLTSITINTQALQHNWRQVKALAPQAKVLAMVKANAYGHGAATIAHSLTEADGFGVACLDEAIRLRQAGIKTRLVLLQGLFHPSEVATCIEHQLDIVLHHASQFEMLKQAALQTPVNIWLKINTGMNRLGFLPSEIASVLAELTRYPHLRLVTVMTHLAGTCEADDESIRAQTDCFHTSTRQLPSTVWRSIASSSSILRPELGLQADWIRPGIMLYGISPFANTRGQALGLQPVMTFQSALISVYQAQAGQGVGYGSTWHCPETMPIGIAAVGYGDGYPRHIEPGTPVVIGGQRVPIIGHVSMDMLAVDLRKVPQATVGSPVELWGEQLPVEEIARAAKTSPYELVTQITCRVHRFVDRP